ncbi:helix-turn-helix transcriptional regulator [Pseudoflavitalea sp. X16]|nr:helix-turn-helix transcriptional regulator [Paraflavitalea devenefica]
MREIRKHKKLTLQDLEATTGMQNSKISRIENGLTNVEFFTIVRMAEALDVEIMDLFDYDGPLPKSK